MIWVHRCSVSYVSRQAAVGNSGQGACAASLMVHRNRLSSASPDTTRPGAIRPGLYMRTYGDWDARYFVFLASLANAASTSSFLMRASGFPGWPRFCSSVPSPIMPGCGSPGFLLVPLGSGLLVISKSPGAGARNLTASNAVRFHLTVYHL